jgi:hypothetical protein
MGGGEEEGGGGRSGKDDGSSSSGSKYAFTAEERKTNASMEKIGSEYRQFVQTKLHLDNHANVRRDFAAEIQDVLSGFQASNSVGGDLVPPLALGAVSGIQHTPFLVDGGKDQQATRPKPVP